jgi:CRP-like cAMP-binding protein
MDCNLPDFIILDAKKQLAEFNRDLFTGIPAEYWTIRKTVERNEFVDAPGGTNTHLYLVEGGAVKVCCFNGDQEIIMAFGVKDDLVTNLVSFLSDGPSQICLQAIKKTELIGMTKARFMGLVTADPAFAERYRGALENKILETIDRQLNHFSKNPQERVERLLALKPEIFQHIPRKYIAYYLGLAPETLSRLVKS